MNDLTVADIKEKIAMVDKDLLRMQNEPGSDRQRLALIDYKEYLNEQIAELLIQPTPENVDKNLNKPV